MKLFMNQTTLPDSKLSELIEHDLHMSNQYGQMFREIMEGCVCVCAVSYTHLDVYKRQSLWKRMGETVHHNLKQCCLLYTSRCV